MFRDLKEYQELQKLYEEKVSKTEELDEGIGEMLGGVKNQAEKLSSSANQFMKKNEPIKKLRKAVSDIKIGSSTDGNKKFKPFKALAPKKPIGANKDTSSEIESSEAEFKANEGGKFNQRFKDANTDTSKEIESSEQSAKVEAKPKRRPVGSPMDELNPGAAKVKARFKAREAKGLSGLTGKSKDAPKLSGRERAQAIAKARIAAKKASQSKSVDSSSATETKTNTKTNTKPNTETKTNTKPNTETKTNTKPNTETNTKPNTETKTNTKPNTETKTNTKPNTGTDTETKTKKIVPKPNTGTDTETKSNKIIPKPNTGTDTETKTKKIVPKPNTGTDTETKSNNQSSNNQSNNNQTQNNNRRLRPSERKSKMIQNLRNRNNNPNSNSEAGAALRNALNSSYQYDAYDVVLEYLLSTQQVATIEEANYVMTEMDAKTIQDIVSQQLNEQN